MRKLINWLIFIGLVAQKTGEAFEPIIPAYDALKAKNKVIDDLKQSSENFDEQSENGDLVSQQSANKIPLVM